MNQGLLPTSSNDQSFNGGAKSGIQGVRYRPESGSSPSRSKFSSDWKESTSPSAHHDLLMGLLIAGVGSTLLTTVFGLFHVDVFLKAYKLPLDTYSSGNVVYSILNTANDLAGGWVLDSVSATMDRSSLVGIMGCVFAFSFLTPFFRSVQPSSGSWGFLHFVASMSFYDTLFSFTAILTGSIVSDNHRLPDAQRIKFMANGKILNLVASFLVARVGLAVFQVEDLWPFRVFLIIVASISAVLFLVGQELIRGGRSWNLLLAIFPAHSGTGSSSSVLASSTKRKISTKHDSSQSSKLHWKKVANDFWQHKNFWAWVVMEMLFEAQVTFISYFLKTFVDRLLFESGSYSRETCDWILSIVRPLRQILSILCYVPIQKYGYRGLYTTFFVINILLSTSMCLLATSQSSFPILLFLTAYPILSGAVQSSGFHLAMADMVLEMKHMHALQGRFTEPSLAGLFMSANALFCKPAESLLPVVAAKVLQQNEESSDSLYYLLVVPPLLCSVVQLMAWRFYTLTRDRVSDMRQELQSLSKEREDLAP